MIVVVSPAKKLDFESPIDISETTTPVFEKKIKPLSKELKNLKVNDIKKLMKLSDSLSELNFERFQNFSTKKSPKRPAVFAFNGDTYTGLEINSFNKTQIKKAQKNLRILSGLYGILKPLDLIEPYRLEMGTKFSFSSYKNLYDYWKADVTEELNKELKKEKYLVNCASNEYFNVVDKKQLTAEIITPVFKELRNGEYKIISFSAKKARGMMAKYIVQNELKKPEDIKAFDLDGYQFNSELSNESEYVFVR